MPLTLFNTLTRRKEPFTPLSKERVTMYTCGPTVYGRPHIGNYSSFLMADLLRRWLTVLGYAVMHVKNITDVGHLVADADEGEDKVQQQAKKEKGAVTKDAVIQLARSYEAQYLEDERSLNMVEPEERPRATETIPEMITLIQELIDKGHAYETEDGVYFSIESFSAYGSLSGNTLANLDNLEKGVRVDVRGGKKHPADFALWKKRVGEHSAHVLHWDSPWGDGFPGWHIECSAMSMKFLGNTIDIHTGGEDNIFPHHECEIAQSEGATGKPFVHTWLHKRRVNFADEKMSKSLGNVLTLSDIEERGFSPLDLRYFFLSSHYRSHTQFTWKGLEDAKKARSKIMEWIEEMREQAGECDLKRFRDAFTDALNDDLNTPEALATIFACMTFTRNAAAGGEELQAFCSMVEETFGCFTEEYSVPDVVRSLVSEREKARAEGDYARSDALRDEVTQAGFLLEDTEKGVKIIPATRRSA